MSYHPNIELIEQVVDALGELTGQLVFLGGSTTILLLTDPATPPTRASVDVDAIVRIGHLADYHRLGRSLREKGFVEDVGRDAPVCRWRRDELILDVMPTDERILGFGNRWYDHTIDTARDFELPSGRLIRLAGAPCFLATKFEAFHGRGGDDFLANDHFRQALPGHLELMTGTGGRVDRLLERLSAIVSVDD